MRFILALALVGCVNVSTSLAQLDGSDDSVLLLRMASETYVQGSQTVAPLLDHKSLARISAEESELSDLASLISARVVINAADKEESDAGWSAQDKITRRIILKAAVETVGGQVFESATMEGLELLGYAATATVKSGLGALGLVGLAMKQIETEEKLREEIRKFQKSRRAQDQMAKVCQFGHAAWVYEGLISTEIKNQLEKRPTRAIGFDSAFSVTSTAYQHRRELKKSVTGFNVTNQAGRTFKWAVIILRLDCGCKKGSSGFADKGHGEAFERLSDIDKVTSYYVQNWKADEPITIVGLPVPEYYHTVKAVEMFVFTPGMNTKSRLNIQAHKQYLLKNYFPLSMAVLD